MYKCARVLVMAIAPITHYAINITLTKVNRALAHDQLVQEGVVSMHMSYAMCMKGWSRCTCRMPCAQENVGMTHVLELVPTGFGALHKYIMRARFTCAMPQSLSAQVHQHLHV